MYPVCLVFTYLRNLANYKHIFTCIMVYATSLKVIYSFISFWVLYVLEICHKIFWIDELMIFKIFLVK